MYLVLKHVLCYFEMTYSTFVAIKSDFMKNVDATGTAAAAAAALHTSRTTLLPLTAKNYRFMKKIRKICKASVTNYS